MPLNENNDTQAIWKPLGFLVKGKPMQVGFVGGLKA